MADQPAAPVAAGLSLVAPDLDFRFATVRAGFTIGAGILAAKGLPLDPAIWQLRPAHFEFLLIGWTAQFALGAAFWILPRFGALNIRGLDRILALERGCTPGRDEIRDRWEWLATVRRAVGRSWARARLRAACLAACQTAQSVEIFLVGAAFFKRAVSIQHTAISRNRTPANR